MYACPDPGCSHKLLPHIGRSPPSTPNLATSRPPPRPGYTKVHCRHCRRCIPILAHSLYQHHFQQPADWARWCRWFRHDAHGWRRGRGQGQGQGCRQGCSTRRSEAWLWRRRRSRWFWWQDGSDHGGPGHGRRRIRRQRQKGRVLPVIFSLELLPTYAAWWAFMVGTGGGTHNWGRPWVWNYGPFPCG